MKYIQYGFAPWGALNGNEPRAEKTKAQTEDKSKLRWKRKTVIEGSKVSERKMTGKSSKEKERKRKRGEERKKERVEDREKVKRIKPTKECKYTHCI